MTSPPDVAGRIVPDEPGARALAIGRLRAGDVVALPTDTIYGIAVGLATPGGVERLFAIKDRPRNKAIVVLVDDISQVASLVSLPDSARRLAESFWPGGLTLVLPLLANAELAAALTAGTSTLGVRMPAHPCPRALAHELGPLPTTSANRSGQPEALTAADVEAALGDRVALILDGGPSPGGVASTVVDCTGGTGAKPRVVRQGAVDVEAIAAALGDEDPRPGQLRAQRRERW